ncbi:hypothetical protein B0H10DRAFT_1944943 [Mycena sp. CBHHK59/15]|nr:hypothetical protein B0H10DRAFT_1944943 [Mycena sp. CBHHK59/15]
MKYIFCRPRFRTFDGGPACWWLCRIIDLPCAHLSTIEDAQDSQENIHCSAWEQWHVYFESQDNPSSDSGSEDVDSDDKMAWESATDAEPEDPRYSEAWQELPLPMTFDEWAEKRAAQSKRVEEKCRIAEMRGAERGRQVPQMIRKHQKARENLVMCLLKAVDKLTHLLAPGSPTQLLLLPKHYPVYGVQATSTKRSDGTRHDAFAFVMCKMLWLLMHMWITIANSHN